MNLRKKSSTPPIVLAVLYTNLVQVLHAEVDYFIHSPRSDL